MRWLLSISFFLLLVSCRKTKLKDEYAIFEGKWKWVRAVELKTSLSGGAEFINNYTASDYPDEYFMEFDRKGKVRFLKNEQQELEYRIVIRSFSENCNTFPGCHLFGIRFDNDKDKPFGGYVGYDSLSCGSGSTNLPLIKHKDSDYEYAYSHYFVKVN